jgi:hypothetical protein
MPISIAPLNGQSSSKKGTFDENRYIADFRIDAHNFLPAPREFENPE